MFPHLPDANPTRGPSRSSTRTPIRAIAFTNSPHLTKPHDGVSNRAVELITPHPQPVREGAPLTVAGGHPDIVSVADDVLVVVGGQ